MEDGQGSENQNRAPQQPDEVTALIEQQQATEETRRGNGNQETPEQRTETLWHDFWHIPLKDRLMIWLTLLLFIIGAFTAWIVVRQLRIMDDKLTEIKTGGDQTERLVITGLGQMAVANRAAISAGIQAKAAKDSVKAIQQQTETSARPWLKVSEIDIARPMTINIKRGSYFDGSCDNSEYRQDACQRGLGYG
jgi:hypothetical protein